MELEWTCFEAKTESGESVFYVCLNGWIVGPAFPSKELALKFAHFLETQAELKTYLYESMKRYEAESQRDRPHPRGL